MQQALADLGYVIQPDGKYGPRTATIVRTFKKDNRLGFEQYGDVGPGTMGRLDRLFPPGPLPVCPDDVPIAQTGGDRLGLAPGREGDPAPAAPDQCVLPPVPPTPEVCPKPAPPLLSPAVEVAFESKAAEALTRLAASPSGGGSSGGHTPGGAIADFPAWFSELQAQLIPRTTWDQLEEDAQQILRDYAMARLALQHCGRDKVPATVRVFCDYIGRSTSNQVAAKAKGFKHSGEVGGGSDAKNWCAAAGSSSVDLALQGMGLTYAIDRGTWLNSPPGVKGVGLPAAATSETIEPGDQVSYIGGGSIAVGGHTVTAVTSGGSTFSHVSGNAGGGKSGSVRMGTSPLRKQPPKSVTFDEIKQKSPATLNAPTDAIWVYVVVKYSALWRDLQAFNGTNRGVWTTPEGLKLLAKYKLKPK